MATLNYNVQEHNYIKRNKIITVSCYLSLFIFIYPTHM